MESIVVRMVNLASNPTESSIREFIELTVPLKGNIENLLIGKDQISQLVYAYIVFQYHCDAATVVKQLNETSFNNLTLDVELIGPNLSFKKYKVEKRHK